MTPARDTGTVVLRLAGPLQAWSRQRRNEGAHGRRPCGDHPTKTGVIGLLANALGRDRADDVTDLAALTFAVREDRPGQRHRDLHTSGGGTMPLTPGQALRDKTVTARLAALGEHASTRQVRHAVTTVYGPPYRVTADRTGRPVGKVNPDPVMTTDEALADAAFTVALTGPAPVVSRIADALETPARTVHLGRAGYLPTGALLVALTGHDDPVAALTDTPADETATIRTMRLWHETTTGGQPVPDQPVNYSSRRAVWRHEATTTVTPPTRPDDAPATAVTDMFTPPDQEPASSVADMFTPPAEDDTA